MKTILKLILLFVLVNVIGKYLFPYLCYLTGVTPENLCYAVAAIVALYGLLLLIPSSIVNINKKVNKKRALWVIAAAGAILSCLPLTLQWLGDKYDGEYMTTFKTGTGEGLIDKFGREFIEPKYRCIVKAFDKNNKSYTFIGINCIEIKTDNDYMKRPKPAEFVLYMHDEKGKIRDVIEIKESDCDFIDEYITKYVGKIEETYGNEIQWVKEDYKMLNTGRTGLTQSENLRTPPNTDRTPVNITTLESESYKPREPERHETSVPVQEWRQCTNCLGSGQCPYCYGQGHSVNVYGNDVDCPVCTDGRCSICAGQGGHYEIEYKKKIEYY